MSPSFAAIAGVALLTLVSATPATAGRTLELLASDEDGPCYDYPVGALSHDGQHLVLTQLCIATTGESAIRGTLWRNFRDSSPTASRVWSPGYFQDISADGHAAVGQATRVGPFGDRQEGVVLRDTGETLGIGFLDDADPSSNSFATAISDDGSTVVGGTYNASGNGSPIAWTAATGLYEIPTGMNPTPCEGDCEAHWGYATGVTQDGSVVVGNFDHRPFRWDEIHGPSPLVDDQSDAVHHLSATAISADGSSVVGRGTFDGENRPFIASDATGLIDLHDPTTGLGLGLVPKSVSRDGSVVVGGGWTDSLYSTSWSDDRAFLWTRTTGMQDLRTALEDLGIDTAEWDGLSSAWAVSGDGSTIVGAGFHRSDGVSPATFHASLLPAPPLGVGLCNLGQPNCHTVEILARTGQTIRLRNEFTTFELTRIAYFSKAVINASGGVAFSAGLGDPTPGATDGPGSVVFGPDGSGKSRICLILPLTIPSLGIRTTDLPSVRSPDFALLADGAVYFRGELAQFDGLWRCRARSHEVETLALVDRDLPDGAGDHVDQIFDRFQIDGVGRVSFRALISRLGSPPAPWGPSIVGPGFDGGPRVVLRPGDTPPGVADRTYGGAYFHTMSSSGKLAFVGMLGEFGAHGPDEQDALWGTDPEGELALIFRTGDPAPGFFGSKTFRAQGSFATPAINARGDVATAATLAGSGPIESTIWKWSPDGDLSLIARESEALPGLESGRTVEWFDDPLINDRSDILLSVILDYGPTHNHGYWLHTAEGQRVPLLQTGQAAPALPDGVVLGESTWIEMPSYYPDEGDLAYTALTDSGLALLEFHLTGTGVDSTNDRALYLLDRIGNATLVLRRGDEIPVAYQDIRTVDDFRVWYGYVDGYGRSPINDRGDVVAILEFVDGTQAVAKIAAPEPDAVAMLALGALGLFAISIARWRPRGPNSPSGAPSGSSPRSATARRP